MEQHGALRNARGAASILQERDIVWPDCGTMQKTIAASGKRVVETYGARNRKRWHHLLDVTRDEVHEHALDAKQITERGDDHMLECKCICWNLVQRVREVLQHDQCFSAGILELLFELMRGVERVDV